MRAVLLLFFTSISGLLFAQPYTTEPSSRRLVHTLSLQLGVFPSSFLRAREDYSVAGIQGNFWRERYRSAGISYEIGSAAHDNILHYRLEMGYYDFRLDDFRGGVTSPLIPFSEWQGSLLSVTPTILAIPAGEQWIKPVLGLGLMFTIPLGDELSFTYSEEEQSNAGAPLITLQENGVLNGAGLFFLGGGRFRLSRYLQLGTEVKATWLQQQTNYLARKGAYRPASVTDSRSIFSRTLHIWGSLVLSFTL